MKRRMITAALVLGAMTGTVPAQPRSLVGHWTEALSKVRCFAVRGFLLRSDGTALIDWADMQRVPPIDKHYDGRWTLEGGVLHLSMTLHLSIGIPSSNVTDVASMDIQLEGPVDGNSKRLDLTITSDGGPNHVRCAYLRDK